MGLAGLVVLYAHLFWVRVPVSIRCTQHTMGDGVQPYSLSPIDGQVREVPRLQFHQRTGPAHSNKYF